MNEFPKLKPLPGGGAVMLRGSRKAARFAPKSLSFAMAHAFTSAFSAASVSISQAITGLSITLAGLSTAQAQSQASNLPQGGVAVHGSATIQQNGNTLNVNTTNGAGNRSVINWQSFNIGAGHTTHINQPNANSSSLNRVVTNAPSQIYGTLRSNGQVILVNQNGIAVGAGGVVDTAGFTASTLNISDADYKAKKLRFEGNALAGSVQVDGVIRSANGDVMLFAPNVTVGKDGLVKSDNGNVIVGAGQSVEVTGRGLEGVKFVIQGADNKAINLGTLQGNAVGVFAGTLRHSGVIQAQTATMEGGRVVLRAVRGVEIVKDASLAKAPVIEANGGVNAQGAAQKGGSIQIESAQGNITIGAGSAISANAGRNLNSNQQLAGMNTAGGAIEIVATQGRVIAEAGSSISATGHPGGTIRIFGGQEARIASSINASSPSLGDASAAGTLVLISPANTGGTIQILSPGTVSLTEGAQLLASGDAGGGTILVGGDYQGANAEIVNAQNTNVSQGVLLEANARFNGDGGKIIVWADQDTYYGGSIKATGGEQGGNGGFGETSGKKHLYFRGRADLSARRGRMGTLLLDPEAITIVGGSVGADNSQVSDKVVNADDGPGGTFTISETALEALTGNILLEATRRIDITGTFNDGTLNIAAGLTLRTRNNPTDTGAVVPGIGISGVGNTIFTLKAGGDIDIIAGSDWGGGINGPGFFTQNFISGANKTSIISTGGSVTVKASGAVSLGNGTVIQAGNDVSISSGNKNGQGNITFSSFGVTQGVQIEGKTVKVNALHAGDVISFSTNTTIKSTDVTVGANGLEFIADRFGLVIGATGVTLTSANGLNIAPLSSGRDMVLGGTDDAPSATGLNLSQAEISTFQANIIRLGAATGYNGNITTQNNTPVNFGSSSIVAMRTGGLIGLANSNAAITVGQLGLEAGGIISLNNAEHNFDVIAANSISGSLSIQRKNNAGYTVGTVDGISGASADVSLALDFFNPTATTGKTIVLKADVLTNGGSININTGVLTSTANLIEIAAPTVTIDSNRFDFGTSGSITLGVQGTSISAGSNISVDQVNRVLVVDASTVGNGLRGTISMSNVVANGGGARLKQLTLNSSATVGALGAIILPGTINLDGGNMLVNGRATLTAAGGTTINSSNSGLIQFQGDIQGNKGLFINAPLGSVSFEGAVGMDPLVSGTAAALTSLTVASTSGDITVQKNLLTSGNLYLAANQIEIESTANVITSSANATLTGGNSVIIDGSIKAGGAVAGGDIVISATTGSITMGGSAEITGLYKSTGGKTISLTAQNDIVINKLIGTSKYTAVVDISGANKSLTTINAGHDNFDGFGSISLGGFNAYNIGSSSAPIKVANLSGSLEAFGLQGVYISGSAGNLEVAAASVNTTAGAAVMDISSVGNLQILGGAGISVIGSGKADIKLASDLSVQVLTGISGGGVSSSVSIAANERIVIDAGANISNLGGLSLSGNKNGYGIRFVDADTVPTAAGSVNIAYASLNQIGSTVGQVLVGKAGLTSGDIGFEGTNAFNFAPGGAKNYSFISGGSISSTTLRTATLDQAGFRAVGNVDLSNFQLQGSAVTVAAQSDTSVITMNAAASILTIGNVGPASANISGLTTLTANQDIRVTNSGGSIQVSKDIISKGQAALTASTTGITIDTGVTVKGVGRNPQPAAVILRGPDVTINGTVDASGWNVALMPYNPGSANASLGAGAGAGFSLTDSDFSKITNADTILVGAAGVRFRDVDFVGDVNVGTANLHIYAGDNTVTASSATAVSQALGSVITTKLLHVDANDKSAVLLRPNLVNAFSGVTSGSNAGISFNNVQSFDIGTLGVMASDPNSTVSLTSLGAINNPNTATIKAGVNVLLSAETGLGTAAAPLLVQSSGTSPLNLSFQLDLNNGGNAGAYITSSSDTALTANTGLGVNAVQIKTGSGATLALASNITSKDNITLTSGTSFGFGIHSITGQSLTLTAASGAITTSNNSGLDVSASNVVLSATTNIGSASQSIFVQADTIDLSVANTVPSQQNKIFMRALPLTGTVLKASQFTIDDSNLVEFNLTASSSVLQFLVDSDVGNGATFNVNLFAPNAPIRLDAPGGLTFSGSGQYRLESAPGIDIASNVTVNNTLTIAGPSTVLAGATLAGGGTIDNTGHVLTLNLNGAIAPGGSGAVGTLTISGAADLSAGKLLFDLDTTTSYDKLNVLGNVQLGAPVVLSDINGYYSVGDSFNLITYGNASGSVPTLDITAVPDATYIGSTTSTGNGSLVVTVDSLINRWRNTPTDQLWETASNWTRNHVPTAFENVVVNPTLNAQTVTISSGGSVLSIDLPGDDRLVINQTFNLGAGVSTIGATAGVELNSLLTGTGTTLNLAGTISANGTGGGLSMDGFSAFNNSGVVQIGSGGFFQMGALGSDSNGAYSIASGATLLLVNSSRTFGNTTKLDGAGTIRLGASSSATPLTLSSGIGGTFMDNGTIDIDSGNLLLSGFVDQLKALKISSSGTLRTATSADTLDVTTSLSANGGNIIGAGTLTTSGSSSTSGILKLDGGNWVNSGSLGFTANTLQDSIEISNNGVFTNASSGTISSGNLQHYAVFDGAGFGSGGKVVNNGLIDLTQATPGTRFLNVAELQNSASGKIKLSGLGDFQNFDPAFVQAGTLTLAGGATFSSTGNANLLNTGTIQGSGTVSVGSGAFTNQGVLIPGGVSTVGTLTIAGNATLTSGIAELDILSLTSHDGLRVTGALTTGVGFNLRLNGTGAGINSGDAFTLLSSGGAASGTPSLTNNILSKSFTLMQSSANPGRYLLTADSAIANGIWDGGGLTTNWDEAANWSNDTLPTAGTMVTLNPSGSGSITLSSGVNTAGLSGLFLDASDSLFIVSGGSLALPSSNVSLNGTVNLAGGRLVSNNSSDYLGSNFNWSGGVLQGAGATLSAATVSLAGGGVRLLNGVTLNAGASVLSGGRLSLFSGGQLNTGASGLVVNSGATLAFDGGALATANLTNDGLVKINSGVVALPAALFTNGAFEIASGAELSFSNDVNLSSSSKVTGGTFVVASGKTVTSFGALNRGVGSVTQIGGVLATQGGLETDELIFTTGGSLSGMGGTLKVNAKWDDTNAVAITGFDNVTIAQASGDLNIRSNLNVANAMQLTAANGRVLSSSVGGVYAKSVNAVASGDVQLRVSGPGSVTIAATSTGGNIALAALSPLSLAGLSTAVGKTALVEATGNVNQIATINTAGKLEFDLNDSSTKANLTLTDTGNNFGQGITVIDAGQVILRSSAASPLIVSGQMAQLQAFGSNVQLGTAATRLDVTGAAGLVVVAGSNITQGNVLTINGPSDLQALSGSIVLSTASTYGGGVRLLAGNAAEVNSNGALNISQASAKSLTITSGGALSQTGSIISGAVTINAPGQAVNLLGAANDFGSLQINSNTLQLTDTNGLILGGSVATASDINFSGNLSTCACSFVSPTLNLNALSAGSSVNMDVNVSGATSFTTSGGNYSNISYKNASTNAATYDSIFATGNVTLAHAGATTLGIMNAAKLDLTAGGLVNQTGALTVGSVRVSAAGQDILLTQANNAISQFDAIGQNVSLTSKLSVDPNIVATGNVVIYAQAINQTVGNAISSASLTANADNFIKIVGANKLGSVTGSAAAGSININDVGGSLVLNGLAAPAGNITITSTGALAQGSGALSAIGVDLSGSSLGASGSGMLMIDAGNSVSLSASGGDAYVRNSNANQHSLLGGSAAGTLHYETTSGSGYRVIGNVTAVNVDLISAASLSIGAANAPVLVSGGSSVLLDAGMITVGSATGTNSSAVRSGGSLTINSTSDVNIFGGSAAGAFASVDASGPVNVTATDVLRVDGGSGAGAYARLDPTGSNLMSITAGGINLQGGAGSGAYAAIVSDGNITLNAPLLSMTAGSGLDADAVVVSNFGRITPPSNCNGCVTLNISPLGNGTSNVGLFQGATIVAEVNTTGIVGTQLIQIGTVVADAQRDPDERRDTPPEIVVDGVNCP